MEFIRENLLKIVTFIIILIVVVFIFAFVFSGKKLNVTKSYSSMENTMVQSSKRYLNDNKKLLPNEDETSKINLDTLENAKYIDNYTALEDSNVKCTGYVEVTYKNDYIYVPYLKCGKYYETKTIASYIKDNASIVTSGDGLYNYNDTFVYRGENPNNYIYVGNRLYRIIDIKDSKLQLISAKRFNENFVWDDRYNKEKDSNVGINDYNKSRLKESFENILKNNNVNDNKNSYFSSQEIEKMANYDICIGKRSSKFGDINSSNECNVTSPNQKLSLITVSDYARASIDPNCKTIFDKSCMNYNYFSEINSRFRTITATSDNTYQVFYINNGVATLTRASISFSTNIVIYLDASSLYQSGDGTIEKPYIIR